MDGRLAGTKPLSEPMVEHFLFEPKEQTIVQS